MEKFITNTMIKYMKDNNNLRNIVQYQNENDSNDFAVITISHIRTMFGVKHYMVKVYKSNRTIAQVPVYSNINANYIELSFKNAKYTNMSQEEFSRYKELCTILNIQLQDCQYDEMDYFRGRCLVTKNPNKYMDFEITAKEGICSRCGSELSEYDYITHKGLDSSKHTEPHCITNYVAGYGSEYDTSRFEFTLCSKCADKLVEFVKNGN